mgnify:CR=1 FL=1
MGFRHSVAGQTFEFADLATLMARATPLRSGDMLAGVAAQSQTERVAAQMALADLPLRTFIREALVPYEDDEVTRLIADSHDLSAFAPVSSLTVGEFRDYLLARSTDSRVLSDLAPGVTPEMALLIVRESCSVAELVLATLDRMAGR